MEGATQTGDTGLASLVARSADPSGARLVLDALGPAARAAVAADAALARRVVTVAAGSRHLGRLLTGPAGAGALDVLRDLDRGCHPAASTTAELRAWRDLELLRIAARDLLGLATFEATVAALSELAAGVLAAAARIAGAEHLAVIGMGKLGGRELNYSSDVDVVLVAPDGDPAHAAAARRLVAAAGEVVRIDTALRPEGRDGPVVRSLAAYDAHWRRWAAPWELQALLKARPVAGHADLGARFSTLAERRLWHRRFTADDLRSLRELKRRAEQEAAAPPRTARWELKRAPGGIRDIEFSVQLLQLVHGQHDPDLRARGTLPALVQLRAGGYIAEDDAVWLGRAYRLLRRLEHAVQLDEDRQTHVLPAGDRGRHRLARIVGYRDRPRRSALDELDAELAACRAAVRAAHERLYFRPLLEAFAGVEGPLTPEAAATRLAAFGFTDASRTREAVVELSRGLTRSSRLMQQLLPLLLDWLSATADPDLGLLNLRRLTSGPTRATAVATAFRESPEIARRTCTVLGTSRRLGDLLVHHPDLIDLLGAAGAAGAVGDPRRAGDDADPVAAARAALVGRDRDAARRALGRHVDRAVVRIAADDVLGEADDEAVGRRLTTVAEAALDALVDHEAGAVPMAVIALGRFGGRELGYGSDLDLVLVTADAASVAPAERFAARLLRRLRDGDDLLAGADVDLRPEGRAGPLVRSVEGYAAYFGRWAEPWERLAWVRARPVAGDRALGAALLDALEPRIWSPPGADDVRSLRRVKARTESERIPPGEDAAFHLKLGPGGLADVELCVQLLQLQHGPPTPGTTTVEAIDRLTRAGALTAAEAGALSAAHRFCTRVRNRWTLVRGARGDAMPAGEDLARLARSLGTTGPSLREEFRRVTRRARRVVERRFYGR